MTPEQVGLFSTAIIAIIGAIVGGTVKIIEALHSNSAKVVAGQVETRELVAAGQVAGRARGTVRDRKVEEIHLLVNSRLLTVLRMLVAVYKKEAERTKSDEDVEAYHKAQEELSKAEASAVSVSDGIVVQGTSDEEYLAAIAEAKLDQLTSAIILIPEDVEGRKK